MTALSSSGNLAFYRAVFPAAPGYVSPQQSFAPGLQGSVFGQSSPLFPYLGYEDYYAANYRDSRESPNRKSKNDLLPLLLFMIWNVSSRTTKESPTVSSPETTPATVTTTTFSGDCQWAPWSTCSGPCRGTRYRLRKCIGNTQTDSELCNTQTGILRDGLWYRAINCYDYRYIDGFVNYQESIEMCSNQGARVASTGLRDDDVRTQVITSVLPEGNAAFAGISEQAVKGVFEWSDGYVGFPMFGSDHFGTDAIGVRCAYFRARDPWSLSSVPCGLGLPGSLCERKAQ